MKNIAKILFSVVLAATTFGCADFLEIEKYGAPSDNTFWKTESDARRAADGLYFWMNEDGVMGRGFMHYYNCSDDVVTGRSQGGCDKMKNFIADYSRDVVDNWPMMYQLIKLCNDIIVKVPDMNISGQVKNETLGQAYFFRAFAYFWLAPYYGDNGTNGGIPIVDEGLGVNELDVPRPKSVRENYAYCIEDMKKAAEMLPQFSQWGKNDYGRPHKMAAWAYIAKIALWDAQYDAAQYNTVVEYCDKIINTSGTDKRSLINSFADVFKVANNYGSEYIFSSVSSAKFGSILPGVLLENKGWGIYNGWGYFTPTTELVDAFEAGDSRLPVTIAQPGDTMKFFGEERVYYSAASFSGMQINKYMEPFREANAVPSTVNPDGDYPTTTLNIPLIRYAEVLLMKAEALIWQGKNGDAPLNEVRQRAGLAPKTGATKTDLMNERRCELAGEFSNRTLDLIRWGVAKDYLEKPLHGYKAKPKAGVVVPQSKDDLEITKVQVWPARTFNPAVNNVFPIPINEISKSRNLKQNIGY